jgi:hypothetical protein
MKKPNPLKIITILTLLLLAFSARAVVIFQDTFNYPSGEIYTDSGGPTNGAWSIPYGNSVGTNIQPVVGANTIQVTDLKSDAALAYFTNGLVSANLLNYGTGGTIYITNSSAYYFASNSPVTALYASFSLTMPNNGSSLETAYFAGLSDTNFDYRCRIFIVTNNVTPGDYRLGIDNYSTPSVATNVINQDLVPGNTYTVVARYVLSTGLSTIWVNPIAETNTALTITTNSTGNVFLGGANSSGSGFGTAASCFFLRSTTGGAQIQLGNLIIGTLFSDVLPSSAGSNLPFFVTQPQGNTSLFVGNNFTNTILVGGDIPVGYQWYLTSNSVTTAISAATNATLILLNLATNESGYYTVVATNDAGSVTSSPAYVLINPTPVAPTFSSPVSAFTQTNVLGDTVVFTVAASGVPTPTYQWFVITNGVSGSITNPVPGANVSGTNSTTLTITSVQTNQSGIYFARATNLVAGVNSPQMTLVVNPIPFVTIAALRSMVDATYANTNGTSLFTVQGIVTTWTNMSTATAPEFFIQDATAGIEVYWPGTGGSNTPPAGALVRITAPLQYPIFDLLSLEPEFTNPLETVTIISTNNPLPKAQPLPFDPYIQNNYAVMQQMVGSYFVASNLFLDLADGPTFGGGDNDPLDNIASNVLSDINGAATYDYTFTNQSGQTFVIYYNTHTDIPGKTKPTGPVTIYGILGQYAPNSPYIGGYEFTPSRFADIISYAHITNVLSNARAGDLATNSYTELVVRPGETLTTYLSIGDAAGGIVTLTPTGTAPATSSWTIGAPEHDRDGCVPIHRQRIGRGNPIHDSTGRHQLGRHHLYRELYGVCADGAGTADRHYRIPGRSGYQSRFSFLQPAGARLGHQWRQHQRPIR